MSRREKSQSMVGQDPGWRAQRVHVEYRLFPPLRAIQYIASLDLPLHRMRLIRLSGRLRRPPGGPRFYEHRLSFTVSPFGRKRDVDRLASVLS